MKLVLAGVLALGILSGALTGNLSGSEAGELSDTALPQAQYCCKVCTVGKACGDSCISRDKECHRPPGCACDG